ncbi:type I-F CRISPR-associated protein Csy1 [Thiohalomonas denitrificans]|uniref:type I-F CRISPR-associated protein Csy1 n=1 Tax=Thiohalomonas denitrificans TaxID=415747 RepID=UPI0026E9F03C|nr:type I-F CRISPR-associated protein Csy1 [Thiohalomonas denitrificans]
MVVPESSISPESVRQVITQFLQERLQPKLDKLKEGEDDKREKLLEAHQPERWIYNAASRVGQIQQVTHAIKFTHPDARGTSLNAPGNPQAGDLLVGTHTLDEAAPDIVGNAAALDVYKFLKLEVGGKSLLDLALEGDSALQAAFSDNAEQAKSWMEAFTGLIEPKGELASHRLAKQLYWPLGKGEYHLLAPLFPTSLVHRVVSGIRVDRFSEEAKAARKAYWDREPHPHGFCEYPDLAIQNFGGTKPQNISQLNSERYGENYLLAALPPTWYSTPVRTPLNTESVFDHVFERRKRVRILLRTLGDFLKGVQDINNIRIRETRADLVGHLRDEALLFAAELHELKPGWTVDEKCRLNAAEQCWLDPGRAAQDEAFATLCARGDWKEEVCRRFANWLNATLTSTRTPMGKDEAHEWQSVMEKEMKLMRMEVDFDE